MSFEQTKTRVLKLLPANSLRGRLAWGTFWSLIATGLAQGSIILASIVSARILGKVGFGELGIINSTIGMLGVFAGFGLGMTATKFVAEYRVTDPDRAGRLIGLSTLVAVASGGLITLLMVVFAPRIASTLAAPQLVREFRIGALWLFFNALNGAQTGALSGFEAFRSIARASLVRGLLSFPLTVLGVWHWHLAGAVAGLAIGVGGACVVNQWILHEECKRAGVAIRYRGLAPECHILGSFSLPAFLASAMTGPAAWIANTLLVNRPDGYPEMGILNAANQWRLAVLVVPVLVGQVAIPIFSSVQHEEGGGSVRRVLRGSILVNGLSTIPLLLILIPCSNWIMSFYGRSFVGRGAVLQVTLLAAALSAIQSPVGNLITGFGEMWAGFFMNAAWGICFVGAAYGLLTLGWGAQAISCAYLIAYLAHFLWTVSFASRLLRRIETVPIQVAEVIA